MRMEWGRVALFAQQREVIMETKFYHPSYLSQEQAVCFCCCRNTHSFLPDDVGGVNLCERNPTLRLTVSQNRIMSPGRVPRSQPSIGLHMRRTCHEKYKRAPYRIVGRARAHSHAVPQPIMTNSVMTMNSAAMAFMSITLWSPPSKPVSDRSTPHAKIVMLCLSSEVR